MITPTDAEIAWCAGLFEGEGSLHLTPTKRHAVLQVRMTDRDVLETLQRHLGGLLKGPYQHSQKRLDGGPRKEFWVWHLLAWREIVPILQLLRPWLHERRRTRVDEVLAHAPEHPVGTLACPAEPIASITPWNRHKALGIPPCEMCLASRRMYLREYKQRPEVREKTASYRKWLKEVYAPSKRISH